MNARTSGAKRMRPRINLCDLFRGPKFNRIPRYGQRLPLVDHETVVSLIANTTTVAGLKVKAKLNRRRYDSLLRLHSPREVPEGFRAGLKP